MNHFQKQYLTSVIEHNKRVDSVLKRLSQKDRAALTMLRNAASSIHEDVCDGMYNGYVSLSVEDMVGLKRALDDFDGRFSELELPSFSDVDGEDD